MSNTDQEDLDRSVEATLGIVNSMVATGNGSTPSTVNRTIDPGSENIMRASELSSGALRESYDECANRAIRLARANVEKAEEDLRDAEKFAQACRAHGKHVAEKLEAGFSRSASLAAKLADGEDLIESGK